MIGDLEYDLGVICIDELVCNLFGGERYSSGFGFRYLFTRQVIQNHENPALARASTILANIRVRDCIGDRTMRDSHHIVCEHATGLSMTGVTIVTVSVHGYPRLLIYISFILV